MLLGTGVNVFGSVTVGQNSKVGAGSLVVEDVPPNCVAGGSTLSLKPLCPQRRGVLLRFPCISLAELLQDSQLCPTARNRLVLEVHNSLA